MENQAASHKTGPRWVTFPSLPLEPTGRLAVLQLLKSKLLVLVLLSCLKVQTESNPLFPSPQISRIGSILEENVKT